MSLRTSRSARSTTLWLSAALLLAAGPVAAQVAAQETSRGGSIFWLPQPAGRLQVGEEAGGSLSSADFRLPNDAYMDVWELTGRAGESVTIDMRSTDFDAYLYLIGPGIPTTLSDDDGGGGCHARISVRLLETGTYRVVATAALSDRTGVYTLSASATPAPPSQARCGGPDPQAFLRMPTGDRSIAPGRTVDGTLSSADLSLEHGPYAQAWALEARAGQTVTVTLESDAFDAYLYLVGPGLELLSDDDGAGELNSRITVILPETGTYRIVASSLSAGETGPYRLSVLSP
jgi:hypothetical protein